MAETPLSREAAVRVLARLVLAGAAPYDELARAGRTMAQELFSEDISLVYGDGPWAGAWTLADADDAEIVAWLLRVAVDLRSRLPLRPRDRWPR